MSRGSSKVWAAMAAGLGLPEEDGTRGKEEERIEGRISLLSIDVWRRKRKGYSGDGWMCR